MKVVMTTILKTKRVVKSIAAIMTVTAIVTLAGCNTNKTAANERYSLWSEPVAVIGIENLYKVDAHLYRSSQPDAAGFEKLYELGIRYDLNLRELNEDRKFLGELPVVDYHIPVNASMMSYNELVAGVSLIMKADGPVLVHCMHGSDRTGVIVAAYRIAAQGWSKEEALSEFLYGGFGFHNFWFPNLPELILSIDEGTFRRDVSNCRS